MTNTSLIRLALAFGLVMSSSLQAALIYDNGAPSTSLFGTRMSDNLVADDFSIGATTDFTNIRLWTLQSALGDYAGSIYWAIYSNTGSTPNLIVQGGVTATLTGTATGNSSGFGYTEYQFNIPVSFQLTAGTYWLGLHNGALANTGGVNPPEIQWSATSGTTGNIGVYQDLVNAPGIWIPNQDQAFRLDGTLASGVPEPSSFLLLASGLLGGAYLRRKLADSRKTRSEMTMLKTLSLALLSALAATAQTSGPIVTQPAFTAFSAPLEDIARFAPASAFNSLNGYIERDHTIPKRTSNTSRNGFIAPPNLSVSATNNYRQTANFQPMGVTLGANFEALGVGTPNFSISGAPPDTTMAVSATQIVQWVNSQLAVYDKSGNRLLSGNGFVNGNTIWSALGGASLCATTNRGDPLVQYDKLANRWILSQFAFNANNTLNSQCFAVSQTSNAMGVYNLYEYSFGASLPDYGKIGVWPNAYFMSYNMFTNTNFTDTRACAYDRAAMLAGNAATQICFADPNTGSYLPSDVDGTTPPPVGTPNFFITWDWPVLANGPYTMRMVKFVPNFNTPANSTFNDGVGGATFSFVAFPLSAATVAPCNDAFPQTCIPQLGTTQQLDTLGDRHMYRLVYRNFGGYDALLITQSVDDNPGASTSQVRWFEIRTPNANPPVVYQNSTYTPDSTFRWMSSGAFDKLGNIAIGYSASSAAINPAIRIAGRRKTDPVNLLRTEQTVQAGTGSQALNLSRWGDYSTMQVDPVNDCTFWYTTEYIGATGTFNWRTRIVSFKYPNCN